MEEPLQIDIVRKTLPALKSSVFRDFKWVLQEMGLWDRDAFHATTMTYRLVSPKGHESYFDFYSLDDEQKLRGRKRDIAWINEANEADYDHFFQLNVRTAKQIYLDYNPSDEYHWIYDKVLTRDDCTFIQSTFHDNPAIPDEILKEILRLENEDEQLWKVFGLGERGSAKETIYTKWQVGRPEEKVIDVSYGIDFGYNHPTALLEIQELDSGIYVKELIYESYLTNEELIQKMRGLDLKKNREIIADSEDPARIEEIRKAGFNIKPAVKGPNSVYNGIDLVKRKRIFVDPEAVNVLKEIKSYKWKVDRTGKVLDEPVKFNDHAMDALRYPVFTKHWVPKFNQKRYEAK